MTLFSRILGFVRDVLIARLFGADAASDAFFVAFRIPNLLRRLFAEGAFTQAFLPVLAEAKNRHDHSGLQTLLDRTAGTLAVLLLGLVILGMLLASWLIRLIAPGFSDTDGTFTLATEMLRITLPYAGLIGMTALCGAVFNLYGYFVIPAATPALLNIAMIAAALWLAPYLAEPVTALAWGVLLAGFLQLAWQWPGLYRLGLWPRLRAGWRDPAVSNMLRAMLPALFGVSVTQLNLLLNTLIASLLATGSVSWLYYADRLLEFPQGLLGVALATVILPHLSRYHATDDATGFSRALDRGLRLVLLLGLPATVGLLLLSEELMAVLFRHDAFGDTDVIQAGRALFAYALGLPAYLLIKILVPGFTARQDVKTPARHAGYAVAINLLLNVILVWPLAHAGLALATTLATWINACGLLLTVYRRQIYHPVPGWAVFLLRLLLANLVLALFLWYWRAELPWSGWQGHEGLIQTGEGIAVAVVLYGGTLLALGMRKSQWTD